MTTAQDTTQQQHNVMQHILPSNTTSCSKQHQTAPRPVADTFSTFSPLNEKDDVIDEKKKEKHEQTQMKKQDKEMTFATSETSAFEA